MIWREVSRTHEAWKKNPRKSPPIVVSMGDVAASGGYYVAAGTDHIFAQPTTLTGSIGVVSLHFDISGLLQKLGVATHTFKRGKNADIAGFYRPFTADERARMDASIRRVYDLFRKRVGDARGKTLEQVDELGRGHVYSGIDAKELGLVDAFGGLREAVALVRQRSGVGDRRELQLRILPVRKTILDLVLDLLGPERGDKGLRGRIQARRDAEPPLPLVLTTAFARLPSRSCSSRRTNRAPSCRSSTRSSDARLDASRARIHPSTRVCDGSHPLALSGNLSGDAHEQAAADRDRAVP
nr:S49 family peptidase [Nannocystis pusilla]